MTLYGYGGTGPHLMVTKPGSYRTGSYLSDDACQPTSEVDYCFLRTGLSLVTFGDSGSPWVVSDAVPFGVDVESAGSLDDRSEFAANVWITSVPPRPASTRATHAKQK